VSGSEGAGGQQWLPATRENFQYVEVGWADGIAGAILEKGMPATSELRSSPVPDESGFQPTVEPTAFQAVVAQFRVRMNWGLRQSSGRRINRWPKRFRLR
jgi:hypothetical protein